VVPQGQKAYVIKVVDGADKDSKVSQRVEVRVGIRRPGKVEIVEGLGEGDTVVIAGQQRIQKDGSALRVLDINRPRGEGGQRLRPVRRARAAPWGWAPRPPRLPHRRRRRPDLRPPLPAQLAAAAKAPQGPNPCLVDSGRERGTGRGRVRARSGEGSGRKGEVRGAPARS
jgi:membrane fusion protein (multidrug efflux system)